MFIAYLLMSKCLQVKVSQMVSDLQKCKKMLKFKHTIMVPSASDQSVYVTLM